LSLTIRLTKLMFSYVLFIGLAAYVMGILNTLKNFAVSAASYCFLNITLIFFGLYICPKLKEPVIGMGIAVLIGGILQLAVQLPMLYRKGFRFSFCFNLKHPAIKKISRLFVPRVIGASIYQLNIVIDTMFASIGSIVGYQATAALYYANRLIQFPTAIFGIAMATACLPSMSRHVVNNDLAQLKSTLVLSLRLLLILLIPSALGLFVLSVPITRVLFERGKFNAYSTQITAIVLMCYCFGIFAYGGVKVVTSCFYSLKDTRTPVKITFFCLGLNIVLDIIFMRPFQAGGLALATSISAIANFIALIFCLRDKIGILGIRKLKVCLMSVCISSLLMGIFCWFGHKFFTGVFSKEWVGLLCTILLGAGVYLFSGWRFGLFKKNGVYTQT
ncbi:MAG: murein biosynthesis integral membrane protein MurJ, partial [Candidatus Omnitrophota bacterium]